MQRQAQLWISSNFFSVFFTWGIFLPYWTGYLADEKGLGITQASFVMSAGMAVRALSTFLFFPAITKRFSLSAVQRGLALAALAVLTAYIAASTPLPLTLATIAFSFFYPVLLPSMESSASVLVQDGAIDYGKSRSFGSIGYALSVVVIGALTSLYGDGAILYTMMAGLAFFFFTQNLSTPRSLQAIPERGKGEKAVLFRELWSDTGFRIVLILGFLLQGAHASYNNYGFVLLKGLGVDGWLIGLILNIALLFEILLFRFADGLFRHTRVSTIFLLSALGASLRWTLIGLFPFVWIFALTQALHAVSFGFSHYAFMRYSASHIEPRLMPAAQGIYSALAFGLSYSVFTYAGGYLYRASPQLAFLGMLACTIPALVIVLATRRKGNY